MFRRPARRMALAVLAAALAARCGSSGTAAPSAAPPAPVTVAVAEQRDVPVELRAIGHVEASSSVGVRSQVGGPLDTAHFSRGDRVRRGQLLFTIDPRPFRVALEQAEAVLARDRALLDNAKSEAERYAGLVDKDYVTREQYESRTSNAAALESTVRADEAAVANAKLQLEYTEIRSPIDGRAGEILVQAGNLVKANADTPMVVLLRTEPILVTFSVAERYLERVRRRAAEGKLEVLAHAQSDGGDPSRGTLTFLDNTVDTTTGTIELKATFPNRDEALWPGQFLEVTLVLATQPGAIVVPARAVQQGQSGSYVFVVAADRKVEQRAVEVDRTVGMDAVIAKGVAAGEQVVTDGQLRLVPGATVEIKEAS